MPSYTYICFECTNMFDVTMSMALISNFPTYQCPKCLSIARRVFTPSYINTGIKSRVFYQWKGDPDKCPSYIKELLKVQDRPKGTSDFAKEGEPALGTGRAFEKVRR